MYKQSKISTLSLSLLMLSATTSAFAQITNNPDDINWNYAITGAPLIINQFDMGLGNNVYGVGLGYSTSTFATNASITVNNLKPSDNTIGFTTYLNTDIVAGIGNKLIVKENVFGNNYVVINNTGSSATTGKETLTIIETGNNQATWALKNKVEVGAYEYDIRPTAANANNIELYSSNGGQTTTTADAATSFLNIAYLTTYIENQTLLQRLGDLRNSEVAGVKSDGFWMKGFGGKLSAFSGSAMKGFDMTYTGTQLGIDKNIDIQEGRLLVGIMAGFTRTNPNYREGDGTGKNYTAGLYATYLNDNGIYVDNVLKYNSMHNQFNVKDTVGSTVKGTGKTQGIMLSAEVGKRFWLESKQQGFYLEPQAQLSYGYQNGDTVHASNGLKVGLSHYNSTLGRISGIAGYQIQGQNPINIYVKTGVVREMSGGASYRFNNGEKKATPSAQAGLIMALELT